MWYVTGAQPDFLYSKRIDRSSPEIKKEKGEWEIWSLCMYLCCLFSGSTGREGGPTLSYRAANRFIGPPGRGEGEYLPDTMSVTLFRDGTGTVARL